jgi:hypothetical protein
MLSVVMLSVVMLSVVTPAKIANGRQPKTFLDRVFNYKLDCFDDVCVLIYVDTQPHSIVENSAQV